MQRCYGRHSVSRKFGTTNGLSISLHGVISLPDATSHDKYTFLVATHNPQTQVSMTRKCNNHRPHICPWHCEEATQNTDNNTTPRPQFLKKATSHHCLGEMVAKLERTLSTIFSYTLIYVLHACNHYYKMNVVVYIF